MSEPWLGWHLLPEDRCLQHKVRKVVVQPGRTYSVRGPLAMCEKGLHASQRALDCLGFVDGTVFCRVELIGARIDEKQKSCARKRKVLWMVNAHRILHEFACWCAEQALNTVEKTGRGIDPRSRNAIATKRLWLDGKATDTELAAARHAAWDAAQHAAWAAACAAAWSAARTTPCDAAWEAAWRAAKAAAWHATGHATWHPAWDAAWDAARHAAWDAAWAAQSAELERMLFAEHERLGHD